MLRSPRARPLDQPVGRGSRRYRPDGGVLWPRSLVGAGGSRELDDIGGAGDSSPRGDLGARDALRGARVRAHRSRARAVGPGVRRRERVRAGGDQPRSDRRPRQPLRRCGAPRALALLHRRRSVRLAGLERRRGDEGTYEVIDEDTFVVSKEFPDVTFDYTVEGDTITFEPIIPDCSPDRFEAAWSVSVAYPGETWQRVG
jgi:hypothetical protein